MFENPGADFVPDKIPETTEAGYPIGCKYNGMGNLADRVLKTDLLLFPDGSDNPFKTRLSLYPGSMMAATLWCPWTDKGGCLPHDNLLRPLRDLQDRHPSPVDSLHALGSTGLVACH